MYTHETLFTDCILLYAYHFARYFLIESFSYIIIQLHYDSFYSALLQVIIIIQYPAIPLIHYWFSCTEHFTEHFMSVRIDIPMNDSNGNVTRRHSLL